MDFGAGWNVDAPTAGPRHIVSAGLGLLLNPHERVRAQLYWGHAFQDVNNAANDDIQDLGLHFRVSATAF